MRAAVLTIRPPYVAITIACVLEKKRVTENSKWLAFAYSCTKPALLTPSAPRFRDCEVSLNGSINPLTKDPSVGIGYNCSNRHADSP